MVFAAATEEEIQSLWDDVRIIDGPLEPTDTTKVLTKGKRELQEFMQSHCKVHHYMFSVKKCNDIDHRICKPPRFPPDVFCDIHHLPDPIPDGDKYKDFENQKCMEVKQVRSIAHLFPLQEPKPVECHFPHLPSMLKM